MVRWIVLACCVSLSAHGDDCTEITRRIDSVGPAQLSATYAALAQCDQRVAESHFEIFMQAAPDAETLTTLSVTAIESGTPAPVMTMLEKIPDYSARDVVAGEIGVACADHSDVVGFLQGAHAGLRGRQFAQWSAALVSCESAVFDVWLAEVVAQPPSSAYDERYNAVTSAFVTRLGVAALPILQQAAIAAANDGPFSTLLDRMQASVRPGFGQLSSPDDHAALVAALVSVGRGVVPYQAKLVADRLYDGGDEASAASLLPSIYRDRVQPDGRLKYGAASVEQCANEVVVHLAAVTVPASRWPILADVEPIARAFEPRLACTSDEPWPVLASPEPLLGDKANSAWAAEITARYERDGYSVTLHEEAAIPLP
jgi:hypothetical protein